MLDSQFDINALGVKSAIAILIPSLVVSILINAYFFPGRGRIVFFDIFMSLVAIYTSYPEWRRLGAILFLVFYIALHAAIAFMPAFRDDAYAGVFLLPFAVVDYVMMVIGLRKATLMMSS